MLSSDRIFKLGQKLKFTTEFKLTEDDSNVDPDDVFFELKVPGQEVVSFRFGEDAEVSQIEPGVFQFLYELTVAGSHSIRCYGTGENTAADWVQFFVSNDPF